MQGWTGESRTAPNVYMVNKQTIWWEFKHLDKNYCLNYKAKNMPKNSVVKYRKNVEWLKRGGHIFNLLM